MARGWASKSIDTQQDEASRRSDEVLRQASSNEQVRQQYRRTLELARARSVADLDRATTEVHRAMLRRAIADLDERLRGS